MYTGLHGKNLFLSTNLTDIVILLVTQIRFIALSAEGKKRFIFVPKILQLTCISMN